MSDYLTYRLTDNNVVVKGYGPTSELPARITIWSDTIEINGTHYTPQTLQFLLDRHADFVRKAPHWELQKPE